MLQQIRQKAVFLVHLLTFALAVARPLFQSLAERKRKAAALKQQLEGEMEELRASHEAELTALRDKLRREKISATTAATDQVRGRLYLSLAALPARLVISKHQGSKACDKLPFCWLQQLH